MGEGRWVAMNSLDWVKLIFALAALIEAIACLIQAWKDR
jgi:hypothetical protein